MNDTFFIFDVESIGLHGEGFAVAGGVYIGGAAQSEFRFCCPTESAEGWSDADRKWVAENVPAMEITHRSPTQMRDDFWRQWTSAKERYPGIAMAAECLWPVEAAFVASCVYQAQLERNWQGPYPFHEIASIMLAAGMDPMATYERQPSELPAHEPLADTRLSARLLTEALQKLSTLATKEA